MLEEKWQAYKDQGLKIYVLMGEGIQSNIPPSAEELGIWTGGGASFPILNDPLYVNSQGYIGKIELGSAMLVGPGVKVVKMPPLDLESIEPQ